VQRIDRSRLGELQRHWQPLTRTVGLLFLICETVLKSLLLSAKSDRTNPSTALGRIDNVNTSAYTTGMDVYFVLNGITFVWNDEKARINPINHDGVTFQQAAEVFFDPLLVVVDASRNEEARDAVIGLDRRWNLLYVVFVERENDIIRIISARKATRKEREFYEA
jgi:uncharacterized DUF497 family protein